MKTSQASRGLSAIAELLVKSGSQAVPGVKFSPVLWPTLPVLINASTNYKFRCSAFLTGVVMSRLLCEPSHVLQLYSD